MFLDCSPLVLAVPVRACSKCGEVKPATREHFPVRSSGRLDTQCLLCRAEYDRTYWVANRERRLERKKEYYKENRERVKTRAKKWREANPERVKANNKAWHEANLERAAANNKAWLAVNRERKSAINAKWRKSHPDTVRAATQRHLARKRSLPSAFTASDWQVALDNFGGCCAACGRPPGIWHSIVQDHWIPITAPNCPGTVPWNMIPLCHSTKDGRGGCNKEKSNRAPAEWLIDKFGKRKGRAILKRIEAFLDSRKPVV